jgi:PhnB protein
MRDETMILHGEIKVDDSIIMFADSTEQYPTRPAGFFIYVDVADKIFQNALNNGATAINELSNQSYGRSSGVKDPFENTWWITSLT